MADTSCRMRTAAGSVLGGGGARPFREGPRSPRALPHSVSPSALTQGTRRRYGPLRPRACRRHWPSPPARTSPWNDHAGAHLRPRCCETVVRRQTRLGRRHLHAAVPCSDDARLLRIISILLLLLLAQPFFLTLLLFAAACVRCLCILPGDKHRHPLIFHTHFLL